jgi:hypothetical protein
VPLVASAASPIDHREFLMRTLRIPASVAFVTDVTTPALVDEDGGSGGDALDTAKSRAAEGCYGMRGAEVGLQWDPVTGAVVETGEAA